MIGLVNSWNRVSRIQEGAFIDFAEKDQIKKQFQKC